MEDRDLFVKRLNSLGYSQNDIQKALEAFDSSQGKKTDSTTDANVESDSTASDSGDGSLDSQETNWGDIYNKFYEQDLSSPTDALTVNLPVQSEEEIAQYNVIIENKKSEKKDLETQLNKAFDYDSSSSSGTLFGQLISNTNDFTIQERQADNESSPEQYLTDIVKEKLGGMGSWMFDSESELRKTRYPNLSNDEIDESIKNSFNSQLSEYKQNNASNRNQSAIKNILDQGGDEKDWKTSEYDNIKNAYSGIDSEIASQVDVVKKAGQGSGDPLITYGDELAKLKKLKAEKPGGSSMLYNLDTGDFKIPRPGKPNEKQDNIVPLGIDEKQSQINTTLSELEPSSQLEYLESEFWRSALTLKGLKDEIGETQDWSVKKSATEIAADRNDSDAFNDGIRKKVTMSLKDLMAQSDYYNADPIPMSDFANLKGEAPEELVNKWGAKIKTLKQDRLDYTGEYEALKNMVFLNEGLVDLAKPEYGIIPANMAALKNTAHSLLQPWIGDYGVNQLIGSSPRQDIEATTDVYDILGIEMTPEEVKQTEVSINESVVNGVVGANKMLVEFAGINKGLAITGLTAKFAAVSNALTKGKWVKNGKVISNATMEARASKAGISVDKYAAGLNKGSKLKNLKDVKKGYQGYKFIPATNTTKAIDVLQAGLLEGAKFELFTQFDVLKGKIKPEAGERYGFAEGFGFGMAGRIIAPLSPLLQRQGKLKDIDFKVPLTNIKRGINSRKLFETFVTAPASFVTGSNVGGIMDELVQDALGNSSFKNFIDEKYGDHDNLGRELITEYFIGLGFGGMHFKGFNDFKSKAGLKRGKDKSLDNMTKILRQNDFTIKQTNNMFSESTMNEVGSKLSSEKLSEFYGHYEMFDMFGRRLQDVYRSEGYLDPARADEMVRKEHKQFLEEQADAGIDVTIEVVNNNNLKFGQKPIDANKRAEIKGNNIRYNAERYSPDVMVHEVHHFFTENLFGKDVVFKADFMEQLNDTASKIKISRLITESEAKELGNETLVGEKMDLSQAIKLEKFDITNPRRNTKIAQWELFAHISEQIGDKNNYLDIKDSNGFEGLKTLLATLSKRSGKKLNLSTQGDIVEWFSKYSENVKKGRSVIELFSELKEVVDVEATRINKEQRELFGEEGATTLESRDLVKEKQELIEENKQLFQIKAEGYREKTQENAVKIKELNKNIGISERNVKNIKRYKEGEAGEPLREAAASELLKDNTPIIETWFKKNFKKGLDVSESDFRSSMMEGVVKIFNSYNNYDVPFGYYLKSRLGPQLGNILRRAQAGRTTDIAMSEMSLSVEELQIADTSPELSRSGSESKKGRELVRDLNIPEDVISKAEDRLADLDVSKLTYKTLKDLVPEYTNKLLGVEPKPGNLGKNSVANAQKWFSKDSNARLFIDALPEGTIPMEGAPELVKGTSTGVQNTLLKEFYNSGGRVKTKAGAVVQNKIKGITPRQVKDYFGIKSDGSFVELKNDRSLGQKVKAAVDQIGKAWTNQVVRKTIESNDAMKNISNQIEAGKSQALASKILDNYTLKFPETSYEQVAEDFYNIMIGDRKSLSKDKRRYLSSIGVEPGLSNRNQTWLYGFMDAAAMAGKSKQVRFDKDLQVAELEGLTLSSGEKITPEEIKAINLKANFRMKNGNVIVDKARANRFVDHSIEFSKLLPKEITKNLSFFDQIIFLHQRTTFENVTQKTQEKRVEIGKGEIVGEDGKVITNERFTKGRSRALEVVAKNTLNDVWDKVNLLFTKATSQVLGQKKYNEATTAAEQTKVIEKYFNQFNETNKAKIYDAIASTMEYYIHSGKNKAEVLSRIEWAANAMRSNSNLRLGLRQTAPVLAIYKGSKPMTDARFKLEHAKTSVRQSLTAFELIAQNKWRKSGAETLSDFVGILSPKKLLDIIDAKGGNTNMTALYRMAILEPSTLAEFVTVESGGKQTLLDYILKKGKADIKARRSQERSIERLKADRKLLEDKGLVVQGGETGRYFASKILDNYDKAIALGRKKNKKAKGMSTFDFDETLIIDGENFVVAKKGKETVKISSGNWPIEGPKFAEKGYEFDFSDFVNVRGGKDGPLLQKMKNQLTKYGPDNVFVLTARMQDAAGPIHQWLKGKGIDIPLENITGLGKSQGEAKAQWMLEKFAEGYNDMYFVDDALPNVKAVSDAMSQLDIKSKIQLVKQNNIETKSIEYSKSKKLEWKTDEVGNIKTTFDVAGKKYNFNLDARDSKGSFDVEFNLGGRIDVTGTGDSFRVFRTVYDGLVDLISKNKKIKKIEFSALKGELSRVKLYTTLMDRLGKKLGWETDIWEITSILDGGRFDFELVKPVKSKTAAVQKVLDQLDIKSKVQTDLASKDLSAGANDIMSHSLKIDSDKVFSKAEAKTRGAKISRRRLFMTDGAADLELLLEPLYGKGSKGIDNKEWFVDNLVRPFERGYNDLNNLKQKSINGYMELRKQNKDIVKSLDKEVADTSFTTDMALRVYIWNKSGLKIPGLAKASEAKLVQHVKNDVKLQGYAESVARLTGIKTGLKEPSGNWWAETLAGEVGGLGEGISRSKALAEFIEAKNEIFSEENLNKMESKLGTNWRTNMEDMLDRMETGRTRSANLGEGGAAIMNYLNGSVGTIMNLNTRSAMLQLISSVNFVNHSFNNPLAATKAFANQPQYWKDFMTIMNSDMLKQRRAGLQINVSEAELAAAASGSKNPAKAVIAKILKAGYAPTKIADSFAIASGGATYYRNAINKYIKEGMSKSEAEKKAFIDFSAIAERTQQSSRPDLLSAQQVSIAGRIILPFANTPMQMNRIMMKDLLDIKNGRFKGFTGDGSITNKMSRVSYYGFVQSAIFAGLQSGLYALTVFGDDDKLKQEKKLYSVNTMADSFLRGMGIQGAVMASVKNAILEFQKQNNKGWGADYSEVGEDLLNTSPTIGSKFGKLDAAGNTYKFNKKEILKDGLTLEGPALQGLTMATEALFNVPVNRVLRKVENIKSAMDDQNEAWQRVLVGLGWSKWDVGIGQREKLEEKQGEKEKQKNRPTCVAIKSNGNRCKVKVDAKGSKCVHHKPFKSGQDSNNNGIKEYRCVKITSARVRCKNKTENSNKKCYAHQ